MTLAADVLRAAERLRPWVRETILERSPLLGEACGAHVHLKLENLQHTGSFKVRGAMNKLLSLADEERARGVVAASTGNHGAATAYAMRRLDVPGLVFVPAGANPVKRRAIERCGVEVRVHGHDCVEAEAAARAHAAVHGMTYVSPYNDPAVVAGQGSIAVELLRQCERIDAVFVALGGGGLVGGIASYLKSVLPDVKVVACSPANSRVMIESVRAGEILDLPSTPTLSDGTAGGIEAGSITFELCRDLVDEYVTVTEDEIARALRAFLETHHMLIEGAAAVPLAAWARLGARFAGRHVVLVLCGANIDLDTLRAVLDTPAP